MDTHPELVIALFGGFIALLMLGVPVAWAMGGMALFFAVGCDFANRWAGGEYDLDLGTFSLAVERIFGLMKNGELVALPMFILMGHLLDRSGLAGKLIGAIQDLMRGVRGGLAVGVVLVGVLLAASTGIIGASVVLLGMLSLPTMMKQGYRPELAAGTVCSAGTLGILIPPSIMLIIMADKLRVPTGDLFMGALVPGLLLGALYVAYLLLVARFRPQDAPLPEGGDERTSVAGALKAIAPTLCLVIAVLGSIFFGVATPTEASGLGAVGAGVLGFLGGGFRRKAFRGALEDTVKTMGFLFAIFVGATCFSLALRFLGGDEIVTGLLEDSELSPHTLLALVLGVVFLLGFFLDWIEITLIVLPLVGAVIGDLDFGMGADSGVGQPVKVWFAILCAITLQTSFLTPPVGFALFYLKGVSPKGITTGHIYRGVIPFIVLQLIALIVAVLWPELILWLPGKAF